MYISDLPPYCLSKTKSKLFADDTNLTASANFMTDLKAAVNYGLENLRKWLIANMFSNNNEKSVIAVQKFITTEEPIKFDVGKRECKFS